MFGRVSKHFANLSDIKRCKTCVSGLNAMVSQRNQPFYPISPQTMFEIVLEHFPNLWDVKWCKTCVSSLKELFRGTELAKMVSQRYQPFYPIRPQMMFDNVSEHFANLQHVKRGKTCISSLNALFRGTKLANMVSQRNQAFYPTRPQTMFVSVLEHFANFCTSNEAKVVLWA